MIESLRKTLLKLEKRAEKRGTKRRSFEILRLRALFLLTKIVSLSLPDDVIDAEIPTHHIFEKPLGFWFA